MKRMYFPNREITLDGYCYNITSGGTVYLVVNESLSGTVNVKGSQFRKGECVHTKHGLLISLPNGRTARLWLVLDKVHQEITDKEGKVIFTDAPIPKELVPQ